MSLTETERMKDPEKIAAAVGLPESVGGYAAMILAQLREQDYQIPADARTYPAVVYVAARDEREPITAGEIAEVSGVEETAIAREYRRIIEQLEISPGPSTEAEVAALMEAYISRFGAELDADEATIEMAHDLYQAGVEEGLFGNRTYAVGASICLYAASELRDDDLTQLDFERFGVSRTSIRKAYKPVLELKGETRDAGKLSAEDARDRLTETVEAIHDTLDYPEFVQEAATDIVSTIAEQEWVRGKSPGPIAAGAYWKAATDHKMDLSQSDAAEAAGVHKVTVNRRVATIRETT